MNRKQSKQREIEREASALKRAAGIRQASMVTNERLRADIEARMAEIPMDTRDLTGRVLGDPLPGRSALDRMEAA